MDNEERNKYRAVGAIAVLVVSIMAIFFIFLNAREKKNTSLMLKMFYSDITQTFQFSVNANGPITDWGWKKNSKNEYIFNNYIANYMRVEENCIDVKGKCLPKTNYKNLNNQDTPLNLSNLPSIKLNNGIAFAMDSQSSCRRKNIICAVLYVDLNSVEKPNIIGKDLFVFTIKNSQAVMVNTYNYNLPINQLLYNNQVGCNKNSKLPLSCAAYIQNKGWMIDKNYQW